MTPAELAAMRRRDAAAMLVVRADKHLDEGDRLDILWFVVAPSAEVEAAEEREAERQRRMLNARRVRRAA